MWILQVVFLYHAEDHCRIETLQKGKCEIDDVFISSVGGIIAVTAARVGHWCS